MNFIDRINEERSREEPVALKTPINDYRHPVTLSRISLVGMIHIGQPDYYEQVQAEVSQRQEDNDGIVHFEMVRKPTEHELATATESERRLVADHHASLLKTFELLKFPGMVDQRQALHYLPDWENHDADSLDIVRRLGAFTMRRQMLVAKALPPLFRMFDDHERLAMMTQMLEQSLKGENRNKSFISKVLVGDSDAVILDYRNDIALHAVDEQLREEPDSDIVLIWGAGHLRGLSAGLKRRGYKMQDQTLLTAIDPDLLESKEK